MAKKAKSKDPSVYRVMVMTSDMKHNYHTDFTTKEEALQYVESLTDPHIEWYGVYELDPTCDYLKAVTNKRLIPFDDRIVVKPKESDEKPKRRSVVKKSK